MRFGKKGKLAPRYVGPFEILERIGLVAYRLRLSKELSSVHDNFHVSNLKKCLADANLHVPLEEIKVDKTLSPDIRKVVKDEVTEWLKAGIVRKVRYPTWVANPVLVKKPENSWRMCIDFKDLNKAYPKDLYPLPEIDWKIESLMGFEYKCFLDAYKGYHQIQMVKKDEEKTEFHTDEGVFCYTKMLFGLKKARATYQRLVDTVFEGQMGRNLEAYVDNMVIKSKTELEMIKDVEETLLTLKKESEEIQKKTKTVVNIPSPSNLKQMKWLSGKLSALNRFLSKATERALPCLDTLKKCTNKKDFHWTIEAEEAFQAVKKLIAKLPTLTAPKKEEELMVYLSAANEAVSAVLLVERDGRQALIHYLSRTLQGAEINYPPMEKLTLALVYVARRLRRYFQGQTIKVIMDKPISQILNNRWATGRLAKWGVELEAYGIKYAPKKYDKRTSARRFPGRYNDRGQPYTGESRWSRRCYSRRRKYGRERGHINQST
ncbi:reverse transcriptase domain-containing protein [Tanacetum coccineum]